MRMSEAISAIWSVYGILIESKRGHKSDISSPETLIFLNACATCSELTSNMKYHDLHLRLEKNPDSNKWKLGLPT